MNGTFIAAPASATVPAIPPPPAILRMQAARPGDPPSRPAPKPPDEVLLAEALRRKIARFGSLPPSRRASLVRHHGYALAHLCGATCREIAAEEGLAISTVSHAIRKALKEAGIAARGLGGDV